MANRGMLPKFRPAALGGREAALRPMIRPVRPSAPPPPPSPPQRRISDVHDSGYANAIEGHPDLITPSFADPPTMAAARERLHAIARELPREERFEDETQARPLDEHNRIIAARWSPHRRAEMSAGADMDVPYDALPALNEPPQDSIPSAIPSEIPNHLRPEDRERMGVDRFRDDSVAYNGAPESDPPPAVNFGATGGHPRQNIGTGDSGPRVRNTPQYDVAAYEANYPSSRRQDDGREGSYKREREESYKRERESYRQEEDRRHEEASYRRQEEASFQRQEDRPSYRRQEEASFQRQEDRPSYRRQEEASFQRQEDRPSYRRQEEPGIDNDPRGERTRGPRREESYRREENRREEERREESYRRRNNNVPTQLETPSPSPPAGFVMGVQPIRGQAPMGGFPVDALPMARPQVMMASPAMNVMASPMPMPMPMQMQMPMAPMASPMQMAAPMPMAAGMGMSMVPGRTPQMGIPYGSSMGPRAMHPSMQPMPSPAMHVRAATNRPLYTQGRQPQMTELEEAQQGSKVGRFAWFVFGAAFGIFFAFFATGFVPRLSKKEAEFPSPPPIPQPTQTVAPSAPPAQPVVVAQPAPQPQPIVVPAPVVAAAPVTTPVTATAPVAVAPVAVAPVAAPVAAAPVAAAPVAAPKPVAPRGTRAASIARRNPSPPPAPRPPSASDDEDRPAPKKAEKAEKSNGDSIGDLLNAGLAP